jgi:hypothetical protein
MNKGRVLRVSRGRADRDPMFAPIWYDGAQLLVTINRVEETQPEPVELLPSSDMQQNDHVMKYWAWRLDRMEAKRNG